MNLRMTPTPPPTDGNDPDKDDWQGKINRKQKNERIRNLKNRKRKREITARKAKHLVGIAPVTNFSIEAHMKKTRDYTKAKILAVKEFLQHYLDYTDEELDKIKILDTLVSNKGDDTLYISLENHEDIKEIHVRQAEVKNYRINIRNFIPPQLFTSYMGLNSVCKELREKNPEIKTQLHFGKDDMEVFRKNKGTKEGFRKVNIEEYSEFDSVPDYDYNLEWKARQDKPPRRNVDEYRSNSPPPSMRNNGPMSRQQSVQDFRLTKKGRHNSLSNQGSDVEMIDSPPFKGKNSSEDKTC